MSERRVIGSLAAAVIAALAGGCSETGVEDLGQFVAATKAASPGREPEPLPEVEPYRPFVYTAQGLKDPFAPSAFVQRAVEAREQVADTGIRPDPGRPREELENYALGSLEMVGTVRGYNDPTLWALIKAPDGIVHQVREGNHLGLDHGRIEQITEQRIELTEIVPEETGGWKERSNFLSLAQ